MFPFWANIRLILTPSIKHVKNIINKEKKSIKFLFFFVKEMIRMSSVEVSVVVPVYNTGKFLAECLDSLLLQTFKNFEVICVNDGSLDNSAEILTQYAKKDGRIKIINQKNQGVVTARNNGVAQAKGKYIFPLDSDDKIAPNALEECYLAISEGLGDVITSEVEYFGDVSHLSSNALRMRFPKPTKWNMCFKNCLVNAAMFRKSDFDALGGYDTAFNDGIEDYDLWLNFVMHGKKIYRSNDVLFYYRQKNPLESRQFQTTPKVKGLIKKLKRKYPYYRFVRWLMPFRKIKRVFFKVSNRHIRLLGIIVKKFD